MQLTPPSSTHQRVRTRIAWIAPAIGIALILLGLGIRTPFIKDAEPQSAQWIADIVDHGNWMVPRDYYQMVMRKPPLFYWLAALTVKASGGSVDEVNARVVSLVSGAVLAGEVWAWSAARIGFGGGWLAFAFLLGMYGFASRATTALTDMLMTLLLFSVYIVIEPLVEDDRQPIGTAGKDEQDGSEHQDGLGPGHRWRIIGAGSLLGLALLTKGPVVLALLVLAGGLYLLMRRVNPLPVALQAWPWITLVIGLAIAALWYVPAFISSRDTQLTGIFLAENLGHFMPASAGGTGEAARPVYYILLRMLGGSLPLSLLTPALILAFVFGKFEVRRGLVYQLAMVLAVLLLFSAASAKRDDYILPALPSLAILFAALFTGISQSDVSEGCRNESRWAIKVRDATVVVVAVVMLLGVVAVALLGRFGAVPLMGAHLSSSDQSFTRIFIDGLARLSPPFAIFVLLAVVGAGASMAVFWNARPIVSGAGLAILCLAGCTLWTSTIRPSEAATRSVARFAAEVRAQVRASPLYVAHDDPEFSWYYHRGVPALPRRLAVSGPPAGDLIYFVGRPRDLAEIHPRVRARMRRLLDSHVMGGGGAPALYAMGSTQ